MKTLCWVISDESSNSFAYNLNCPTIPSHCKILLINDRVDLEDQLAKTATLIGGKVHTIDSRADLRTQLASDTSDINMVMVHKFQQRDISLPLKVSEALGTYRAIPTSQTFGVVNDSARIVLMIDEAHRTQGSDLSNNGEKKTKQRFGDYIDTYRLMDAVADGTTLQILYEGRTAEAALNDKHGFETQFENLF
jgi:type I restriction enzyme, R subunit